jgi:hypothetical protein
LDCGYSICKGRGGVGWGGVVKIIVLVEW